MKRIETLVQGWHDVRSQYDDAPTYEWAYLQEQEKRYLRSLRRCGLSTKEIYMRLQEP